MNVFKMNVAHITESWNNFIKNNIRWREKEIILELGQIKL